jgi:hypothetical protein
MIESEVLLMSIDALNNNIKYGDVNLDGIVDGADADALQYYIANRESTEWTEEQKLAADVNVDGIINATDTAILKRYIAGFEGVHLGPEVKEETTTDLEALTDILSRLLGNESTPGTLVTTDNLKTLLPRSIKITKEDDLKYNLTLSTDEKPGILDLSAGLSSKLAADLALYTDSRFCSIYTALDDLERKINELGQQHTLDVYDMHAYFVKDGTTTFGMPLLSADTLSYDTTQDISAFIVDSEPRLTAELTEAKVYIIFKTTRPISINPVLSHTSELPIFTIDGLSPEVSYVCKKLGCGSLTQNTYVIGVKDGNVNNLTPFTVKSDFKNNFLQTGPYSLKVAVTENRQSNPAASVGTAILNIGHTIYTGYSTIPSIAPEQIKDAVGTTFTTTTKTSAVGTINCVIPGDDQETCYYYYYVVPTHMLTFDVSQQELELLFSWQEFGEGGWVREGSIKIDDLDYTVYRTAYALNNINLPIELRLAPHTN